MNVQVLMNRIGEWITLMLGESVLSLLLVVDDFRGHIGQHHKVLTFGILMVNTFILQYVRVKS